MYKYSNYSLWQTCIYFSSVYSIHGHLISKKHSEITSELRFRTFDDQFDKLKLLPSRLYQITACLRAINTAAAYDKDIAFRVEP